MINMHKTIAVVGGGITGLACAHYLQKAIKGEHLPYEVILFEKSDHLGGKICTIRTNGFTIETGPDSFLGNKRPIIELTRDLGIERELVGTNLNQKNNYILHRNRLHLMPPGLMLGIPTQFTPFVKTGLISPWGKLRAALDLILPARKETGDESLGGFLQRRLGHEVAENIAEPLLSGIYAGDTQELSLQATFPQFQMIEKKYGSMIKGMLYSKLNRKKESVADLPQIAQKSLFLTYRNGLDTLVEYLQKGLDQVQIELKKAIQSITPAEEGYLLQMNNGESRLAHAVILTAPAYEAGRMLSHSDAGKTLEEIPYVSVVNVVMSFDPNQLHFPLDGYGFVVPRKEGRQITACTWTSVKWPQTVPNREILLRCYLGHSKDQSYVHLPYDDLVELVRKELRDLMGITGDPRLCYVTRWKDSMPQYTVGHKQRLENLRSHLKIQHPGIFLAGAAYEGVGIPDCIQQGKNAAEQAIGYLVSEIIRKWREVKQ